MRTRCGYTLVELLTVLAIAAVLFSIVGRLIGDGIHISSRARIQAENSQIVTLVMKKWRQELRETAPDEWTSNGKGLKAGKHTVCVADGHLIFNNGTSSNSLALPRGMGCSFSVERNPNLADCAVLMLNVESRYFRSVVTNSIRIVACGRKRRE